MAGLYIHVPFCKSRCVYCGFFSTTHLGMRQKYVDALCREMEQRKGEVTKGHDVIKTIYLGGGTPSQLTDVQLYELFDHIYSEFDVSPDAEVTMECNPDDVTAPFVSLLSQLPVNRVSMGAQTFNSDRLRFLNRRHTSSQVREAIVSMREEGMMNISIDLMYGFPGETLEEWNDDLTAALELGVEHISAYALSFEEGTPLYTMLKEGVVAEMDEEQQRQMYYRMKERLEASGFEHYEISNFSLPGFRSQHNSGYWNHTPYIGLGAGAHSFDGRIRRWNVADVSDYIDGVMALKKYYDEECLDEGSFYNDLIMTALRTRDGLNLSMLDAEKKRYCLEQSAKYVDCGWLRHDGDTLCLTSDGLFVSDRVISDLFWV